MKKNIMCIENCHCKPMKEVRQFRNYITFLLCFVLSLNTAFAGDESVINNKQSELEQLKIEVERLKVKKAGLEVENKKLNDLLRTSTEVNDSKIKEQLEKKLSELIKDNNKKEAELKQIHEKLEKLSKDKTHKSIITGELKKDLEFKKNEVKKAEKLLRTIENEIKIIDNNYRDRIKEINKIEDRYGLERTNYSSINKNDSETEFLNNNTVNTSNGNNSNNSDKQDLFSFFSEENKISENTNNSNKIIIYDFAYSSGFNYCDFKLNANNLNDSVKMSIYKDNGNIIKLFDYSVFRFNKEKKYFEFSWDLKDLVGNSVGKGKYVAKIEVNGQVIKSLEFDLRY